MAEKKRASMRSKKMSDRITYALFLAPALLSFILVEVIPFIQGIYYSFTDWDGLGLKEISWVGLTNYINALADDRFRYSALVTLVFGLLNFVLVNVVSFSLALLVTSKLKGKGIYRACFFVPNLIGGLVLGYIWQFIFNTVITKLGIEWLATHYFLADQKLAILALSITSTWQYAGYIMMIYHTALQGIPKELIESAELDGASWFDRLRYITIPMIANTFTITLFLTLSNSFKQYDVVVSLTNSGPSALWKGKAINSTELLSYNIFKTASVENQMALGQAKAVIFFLVLAVISFIQTSLNRKKELEA